MQPNPPYPQPFKIYRDRRGWPRWWQRYVEAWWIVTGRWSLHRAWQAGHDHGTAMEYQRTVVRVVRYVETQ